VSPEGFQVFTAQLGKDLQAGSNNKRDNDSGSSKRSRLAQSESEAQLIDRDVDRALQAI